MGFLDKVTDTVSDFAGDAFDMAGDAVGGLGNIAGDLVGEFGDDLFGIAGTMIGGPIGGMIGDALGDIVADFGEDLIKGLAGSFAEGGPAGFAKDVLAALIGKADPEKAAGIADFLGQLVGNAASPQEALEQIGSIAELLGIDPAEFSSVLNQLGQQAGVDTGDEAFQQMLRILGEGTPIGQVLAAAAGEGGKQPVGQTPAGTPAAGAPAGGAPAAGAAHAGGGVNTPLGGTIDGADGFLFKPVSDSDGRLVVLLPQEMTGNVQSVVIKDQMGNVIEQGDSKGVANGGREHFRFDRAGGDYPPNITVEVTLRDGSTKEFEIPNPALRWD